MTLPVAVRSLCHEISTRTVATTGAIEKFRAAVNQLLLQRTLLARSKILPEDSPTFFTTTKGTTNRTAATGDFVRSASTDYCSGNLAANRKTATSNTKTNCRIETK